jgi:hypothetical protein
MDYDMSANRFYVDGYSQSVEPINEFEKAIRAVIKSESCDVTGYQATELEHLLREKFLPLVKASALKEADANNANAGINDMLNMNAGRGGQP